jgi:hypothetical protein
MPEDNEGLIERVALKSCPFCGAGAVADETSVGAFVYCPNEECFIQPETGAFQNVADAVAKWNTRTPLQGELQEPSEAMEALLASRGMLLWYRREAPVEYQPAAGAMEGVLAKINAALSASPAEIEAIMRQAAFRATEHHYDISPAELLNAAMLSAAPQDYCGIEQGNEEGNNVE